ncbi:unnamed protein product [marine sediment metagenome]|uniref:Uncharacterized protein n=1 Tax=marine sediment metagenome TaxID=412755 RepID=X1A3D3_9ZZZZ
MKLKIKFMKDFIIIILLTIAISVCLTLTIDDYLDSRESTTTFGGGTITTIASNDAVSDSRSVINTNFANLNNAIHWIVNGSYLISSSSVDLNTGIATTTPKVELAVMGKFLIFPDGTGTTTCSALIEGAMMYSTGTKGWLGCDGSVWTQF